MYKHYIEVNEKDEIIKAFSDAFESPTENSILIRESDQRHFYLGDYEFNPKIVHKFSKYLYVYKDKKIKKSDL